jgi:hypothetical protein
MFNATKLLQQWNNQSGQQKQMIHYFENKTTKGFIEAIKAENGIPFSADNQALRRNAERRKERKKPNWQICPFDDFQVVIKI